GAAVRLTERTRSRAGVLRSLEATDHGTTAGTDDPPKGSLSPMSYVDLHCHLLPGIDDGAATTADALAHARRLHAEGVRDVACTPHVKASIFGDVRLGE